MIEWNEVDLLTCFESEPEIGEDRLSFHYVTWRSGYRLSFTIWPYGEDVHIELRGPSQSLPLVATWLQNCVEVRYVKVGEVESLAFRFREEQRNRPFYRPTELQVRPEFSLTMAT